MSVGGGGVNEDRIGCARARMRICIDLGGEVGLGRAALFLLLTSISYTIYYLAAGDVLEGSAWQKTREASRQLQSLWPGCTEKSRRLLSRRRAERKPAIF